MSTSSSPSPALLPYAMPQASTSDALLSGALAQRVPFVPPTWLDTSDRPEQWDTVPVSPVRSTDTEVLPCIDTFLEANGGADEAVEELDATSEVAGEPTSETLTAVENVHEVALPVEVTPDAVADAVSEPESNVVSEAENDVNVEVDVEVDAEVDVEVDADVNVEVDAEVRVDADADDDFEVEAEDDVEVEAEDDVEVEAEDDVEVEAADEFEVLAEDDVDVEAETDDDVDDWPMTDASADLASLANALPAPSTTATSSPKSGRAESGRAESGRAESELDVWQDDEAWMDIMPALPNPGSGNPSADTSWARAFAEPPAPMNPPTLPAGDAHAAAASLEAIARRLRAGELEVPGYLAEQGDAAALAATLATLLGARH